MAALTDPTLASLALACEYYAANLPNYEENLASLCDLARGKNYAEMLYFYTHGCRSAEQAALLVEASRLAEHMGDDVSVPDERGAQCPVCKCMTLTHRQYQTRSADEGMTSFVSCSNCNYQRRV